MATYGWAGTILRVNLSSGKMEKEPLGEELKNNYLGGRGINSRILYEEIKPGIDPLSPENRLIFGTGLLTGTPMAAGRFTVTAKSPISNILGDANAGGHFSPELKYAGYDHIVFTGKADKPVYLWIDDDRVELRDAEHLWGKTTDVTDRMIKEEIGGSGIHIACIGPGGENLVTFACVIANVHETAGKSGMGAVMGSKNLKAVAVRGTKGVKVAQPEKFRMLILELRKRIMQNPTYAIYAAYGTRFLTAACNMAGSLSVRNGRQTGEFREIDKINHETLKKNFEIKSTACSGCFLNCRKWFEIKEGPYAGEKGVGIEYGCIGSWGPSCGNSYAPSLYKLTYLCNKYGLDATNCGEMVAVAMDWYDLGLITKQDTEGIDLKWGNYEAEIEMCHKIAKREGFGNILAMGPLAAAKKVGRGAEKCLTTSKGMLFTHDDSRGDKSSILGRSTATRGADHLRGLGLSPNPMGLGFEPGEVARIFGSKVMDPSSYEDKALSVYYSQGIATIADSIEICKFHTGWCGQVMHLKDMAPLISAVTGMKVDEGGLREIADRIWTTERAFLVREGITRKDDILDGRHRNEPIPSGPFKGGKQDPEKWDKMLDEYYELVGWDKKTGAPTRTKLEELGLGDIAKELQKMAKNPAA